MTHIPKNKICIVKYNAGNIRSVDFALRRLGVEAEITDDLEKIRTSDKVIFPGVGEASNTMKYLKEHSMDTLLKSLTQPVLGICLGQQLMCEWSEENQGSDELMTTGNSNTQCIGIYKQPVKKFPPTDKVPHMGWNQLNKLTGDLFNGIDEGAYVYFVHSYYVPVGEDTAAESSYILDFSASMQKDNFYATQFHPEKSGDTGQQILKNFIEL